MTPHKTSPLHPPPCCACFLSRQFPTRPQHFGSVFGCSQSGGTDVRKKKEEQSGHTGRAGQRTRSRFSRRSHPEWRWSGERSWPVSTSVSTATYNLWPLPGRWSRGQPAVLAGKPTVPNGMASATKDCALRVGNPTHREVAAYSCCAVCEHLRSADRPEARRVLRTGLRLRTRTLGVDLDLAGG